MASKSNCRYVRVVDAFSSKNNQRVSLKGIIVERTLPRLSKSSDYCCSVRIVDASHHSRGLLVNFYAESMNKLPQIECEGDIILLSHIRAYNKELVAIFSKRYSAFALYEGKYGQSFTPYQAYSNFHAREQGKIFVAELRKWMDSVQLNLVSKESTLLREIREGEKLSLICKILHMHNVNQDDVMLLVWDGTDAPRCNIHEKLMYEKESPLPLQLEGERLSRDILSTFPSVGTVLRVKVEQRRGKLDPSSFSVGRWVKLINVVFDVHAGLWYEMAERRAKGLCFNCDESYARGHKCKRLFWIEVPDSVESDDDDAELEISLNTISGNHSSSTMQLLARVSGIEVSVLVDSGSTHNFLREGLVPSLGLQVCKQPGLQVCVANGDKVPSMGICKAVSLEVESDSFQERFSSKWDRMPFTSFPWPPLVTETEKEDVALVTLMDIIKYSQATAKFRCIVRVVSMLPSNPEDYFSSEGTYRIRLTLEDPTARIHAFLFREQAEVFFNGYPGMDELVRQRKQFLGIAGCNEAEDAPRSPPWILCGIKSYYLDKTRMWETRTFAVFMTRLIC
ncbi:hypothetical protein V2J09_010905 [Rumex salicifolius]